MEDVNLSAPQHDLGMGTTGDVLLALWPLHEATSGRRIAERSGRSVARVAEVLRQLVDVGLVDERRVPPAVLYSLNRDHVLAPVVDALVASRTAWIDRTGDLVRGWAVQPDAVALFGSAIAGTADQTSDIDVLVVRPAHVDPDDDRWQLQMIELMTSLHRATGNDVDLVELTWPELRRNARLRREIRASGRFLLGDLAPAERR